MLKVVKKYTRARAVRRQPSKPTVGFNHILRLTMANISLCSCVVDNERELETSF